MSEKKIFDAHLFVCTNRRETGGCCASRGSEELRSQLKKRAKERWGKQVRINAAGCLGQCDEGIAAVLYPEGRWFLNLKSNDFGQLERAIEDALKTEKK